MYGHMTMSGRVSIDFDLSSLPFLARDWSVGGEPGQLPGAEQGDPRVRGKDDRPGGHVRGRCRDLPPASPNQPRQ